VERVIDPRLKTRPVIVAPGAAPRAAVYDMSEEAYRAGVRKGMGLPTARRLCRDAHIRAPRHDRYERAMRALFKHTLPFSPLAEPGDRDGHMFLDVTGTGRLLGPAVDVARRLRKRIHADLDVLPVWSVASNKLVAKVATRVVKPAGEYVVGAGEEEKFLAPLPLRLMPGIEQQEFCRFRELNLAFVREIASLSEEQLRILFGKRGRYLYETARGIDRSPVYPAKEKSPTVTVGREFDNDTNDSTTLNRTLYTLVETGAAKLRRRRLAAQRVRMVLDYTDGIRHCRDVTVNPATANDLALFALVRTAFERARVRRIRIRHLCLIFEKLIFPSTQMALFPAARKTAEKRAGVVAVIDVVRNRFGHGAIQSAQLLEKRDGTAAETGWPIGPSDV
jgi:DNA polymerase-4